MTKPVCLVTGVGDATGSAIVRRFADGGYRVAMIARNTVRLDRFSKEIEDAYSYPCDVDDLDALEGTIANIKLDLGTGSSVDPQSGGPHVWNPYGVRPHGARA